MSPEQLRSPELIGKSVLEVVSLLPTFPWYVEDKRRPIDRRRIDIKMSSFLLVDYDIQKPRKRIDVTYEIPVPIIPGGGLPMKELDFLMVCEPGRARGLTSIVVVDIEDFRRGIYDAVLDGPFVHLPLIDLDTHINNLSLEELQFIKKEIKEKTELDSGLLLTSGGEGYLHFIGTARLLTARQFVAFLSACLGLTDRAGKSLADSRWTGWSLHPMRYLPEFDEKFGLERRSIYDYYDFTESFATLRITTSEKKPQLPVVVDVL